MLKTEGLEDSDIEEGGHVWVARNEKSGRVEGFYVWRMEHGLPYLLHFLTVPRSPYVGRKLIKKFKDEIRLLGFKRIILNVKDGSLYLERLVERYFGVKPYGKNDGHKFYVVTI